MELIREWEVSENDYLITRQEVVAPEPHGHGRFGGEGFAGWR